MLRSLLDSHVHHLFCLVKFYIFTTNFIAFYAGEFWLIKPAQGFGRLQLCFVVTVSHTHCTHNRPPQRRHEHQCSEQMDRCGPHWLGDWSVYTARTTTMPSPQFPFCIFPKITQNQSLPFFTQIGMSFLIPIKQALKSISGTKHKPRTKKGEERFHNVM